MSDRAKFTPEERQRIQDAVAASANPIACPRCGNPMALGAPAAGGGTIHPIWLIECGVCRARAYVSDVPPDLRPS